MAPTGDGRVNRPWHSPWPSSAMVNRQASSASASWRCRALSSCSSAISGATTSSTRCASRRSATGSCSAAHPIRCASASRRCSTGNASTPLTITAACSSDTCPAAIASRTGSWSWSRACASSSRRFASRLVCRVALAQWLPVSAAPASAPRSRRSAWWATRSSSSVTRLRSAPREVRESASSGPVRDQQPTSVRWSSSVWIRATAAAIGCASGAPNTVAIQGILASGTDTPGPGMRAFPASVEKHFQSFLERRCRWSRQARPAGRWRSRQARPAGRWRSRQARPAGRWRSRQARPAGKRSLVPFADARCSTTERWPASSVDRGPHSGGNPTMRRTSPSLRFSATHDRQRR